MQYINKIKKIAKSKNITLKELINMINMSVPGFYSAIKNDTFSVKTVQKIAKALDVSIIEIFADDNMDISEPPEFSSLTDRDILNIIYKKVCDNNRLLVKRKKTKASS